MTHFIPSIHQMENDPDCFIRELVKPNVTITDLKRSRKTIQQLADETNTQLKKNVYKNYTLFIDTAKEISLLKNEMYTLSNLLSDEQKLLGSLLDISISGDKAHGLTVFEKKEVAAKFRNQGSAILPRSESVHLINTANLSKELQNVLDNIDGLTGQLDSRNRILLMHGELTELDPNDYRPIANQGLVYAELLNDCLILSTSFSSYSRFSNKKYKFQSFNELDNIAVINVKDPNLKNAIKILMSTQTKVYIVGSPEAKTKWLEAFDQAKKQRRASLSLQRRDSMLFIPSHNLSSSSLQSQAKTPMSPIDRPYSSILNSFENSELLEEDESAELIPEWLTNVPEDLDVFIAQRNFEEAVSLINKVNDHFQSYPKCCDNQIQKDLKLRINNKIQDLIDAISNELQITPDRSLQSVPKSARRAVSLLIKLGKSSIATKLFLNQRTALLKFCLRQQKIDCATLQYIKRLSSVFFNNVTETCKEFQRAFDLNQRPQNDQNYTLAPALSTLVVWTKKQLQRFLGTFKQNVFQNATNVPPDVAAECFSIVRNQCKLTKMTGLDLNFYLEYELRMGLEKVVLDYEKKMLEGINIRCNEDKWKANNLQNKNNANKFVEDMKDCGLGCVSNYVFDECRIDLTQNSTSFAKNFLNLVKDLLKMHTDFTRPIIIKTIVETFEIQMKHIEASLKSDKFVNEKKFIRKNVAFLIDTVLEQSLEIYRDEMNNDLDELKKLKQYYQHLKNDSNVKVNFEEEGKTVIFLM